MNAQKEDQILLELKRISKILVMQATQGKTQKEKVAMLTDMGFTPPDIAELLSISLSSVHVNLGRLRRKKSKSTKTKKVQPEQEDKDE